MALTYGLTIFYPSLYRDSATENSTTTSSLLSDGPSGLTISTNLFLGFNMYLMCMGLAIY